MASGGIRPGWPAEVRTRRSRGFPLGWTKYWEWELVICVGIYARKGVGRKEAIPPGFPFGLDRRGSEEAALQGPCGLAGMCILGWVGIGPGSSWESIG